MCKHKTCKKGHFNFIMFPELKTNHSLFTQISFDNNKDFYCKHDFCLVFYVLTFKPKWFSVVLTACYYCIPLIIVMLIYIYILTTMTHSISRIFWLIMYVLDFSYILMTQSYPCEIIFFSNVFFIVIW